MAHQGKRSAGMKPKGPFVITLLGMFGGVFIAILFGVNEDFFKGAIKEGLKENPQIS